MTVTKTAMPIATLRRRSRRPAVIIDSQSRHASRDSCCANHTAVPGWIIGLEASRRRRRGDQREEGVFQAGATADAAARVMTAVGGLAAQLLERAFCHEPAVSDDADAVGHAFGDFENMRGHDDGAAGAGALAQYAFDLPRRAGVEAGERLIENNHPRLVHQRAGK